MGTRVRCGMATPRESRLGWSWDSIARRHSLSEDPPRRERERERLSEERERLSRFSWNPIFSKDTFEEFCRQIPSRSCWTPKEWKWPPQDLQGGPKKLSLPIWLIINSQQKTHIRLSYSKTIGLTCVKKRCQNFFFSKTRIFFKTFESCNGSDLWQKGAVGSSGRRASSLSRPVGARESSSHSGTSLPGEIFKYIFARWNSKSNENGNILKRMLYVCPKVRNGRLQWMVM